MKKIIVGFLIAVLVGVVGIYVFVSRGFMPANADANPSRLERWAAKTSLRATIQREASHEENPVPLTEENLMKGIQLYGVHCAVCHGSADGKPSAIASGLFQKAPQLARHGVEDDPAGFTYWKIAHGIRFTGMPAFGKSLSRDEIWQITLFLQHMDTLPTAAQRRWESVPSAGDPKQAGG